MKQTRIIKQESESGAFRFYYDGLSTFESAIVVGHLPEFPDTIELGSSCEKYPLYDYIIHKPGINFPMLFCTAHSFMLYYAIKHSLQYDFVINIDEHHDFGYDTNSVGYDVKIGNFGLVGVAHQYWNRWAHYSPSDHVVSHKYNELDKPKQLNSLSKGYDYTSLSTAESPVREIEYILQNSRKKSTAITIDADAYRECLFSQEEYRTCITELQQVLQVVIENKDKVGLFCFSVSPQYCTQQDAEIVWYFIRTALSNPPFV